ncbi:MAG: hypothetical protein LBB88_11110 [Planctomycetaceae bacterium]|jgi:hypothetical protein|nr:hypothetical protein [Planctomycetaceae bacterium]
MPCVSLFDQKITDRDAKATADSGSQPPTQVGDLSPKGRVAEGNDKMDSTIIKNLF